MEWKLINIRGAVQTKTNIIEIVNTKLKEMNNENSNSNSIYYF